jgi:hypothetical protein
MTDDERKLWRDYETEVITFLEHSPIGPVAGEIGRIILMGLERCGCFWP